MAVPIYIRSLVFTIVVPGTVIGLVPYWLANSKLDAQLFGKAPETLMADIVGYFLLVIGSLIYLWCVYDFTFIGRGTPAIFDPPRELVIRGLYKYVRNPMYIGVVTALLGQVFIYGSPLILIFAIGFGSVFYVFVIVYEEPVLRKQFGDDYTRYVKLVNRWVPSLTKTSD